MDVAEETSVALWPVSCSSTISCVCGREDMRNGEKLARGGFTGLLGARENASADRFRVGGSASFIAISELQ